MNDEQENSRNRELENSKELEQHSQLIGKQVHDAWIDSKTRNLSVDVLEEIEKRKRSRVRRFAVGVPAFAGALGILLFVVLYQPTGRIEPTSDLITEEFYISEADLSTALVADVSEEEAVDMLVTENVDNNDLLTEQDIDVLFKE